MNDAFAMQYIINIFALNVDCIGHEIVTNATKQNIIRTKVKKEQK